jgi:RHS repeat-associated protein
VTQEIVDNGGPVVKLLQQFNAMSSRTSLEAEIDTGSGYVNDFLNTYSFDNLQRLTRIDQAGQSDGNAVSEKRIDLYNAASQFTTLIRYKDLDGGSGNIVADTAYVYDLAGRLVNLAHYHDMTMLAEYDWTYDLGSRVTTLDFDSAEGDNGLSEYGYDNTSQLVSADHDYMSDGSWSFDENGNRTNTGYTTGANNRLTSDGTWNYGYDDEGNRTWQERISSAQADDKRIEYTWDYRNRLTRIVYKNNQGTITKDIHYVYDVFDRRIEKEIDADGAGSGGSIFVHYIYDGQHIAATFDGNDDLTSRTLHNPQATDMFFAQEDFDTPLENGGSDPAGELLWALLDNLLSNRDLVDNDGDVQNHRVYDPWGNLVTETAAAVDSIFGFTGREIDDESPLQYNRARYYDSTTGRWISEDPIGFAGADTDLYRYVNNAPSNFFDPSGMTRTPIGPPPPGDPRLSVFQFPVTGSGD